MRPAIAILTMFLAFMPFLGHALSLSNFTEASRSFYGCFESCKSGINTIEETLSQYRTVFRADPHAVLNQIERINSQAQSEALKSLVITPKELNILNSSVAPQTFAVVFNSQSFFPREIRAELQYIYLLHFLLKNTSAIPQLKPLLDHVKTKAWNFNLTNLEEMSLFLKLCEFHQDSGCGEIHSRFQQAVQQEVQSSSLENLMKIVLEKVLPLKNILKANPPPEFYSAFTLAQQLDALQNFQGQYYASAGLVPVTPDALTFFILEAYDYSNTLTNILEEVTFLIKDRLNFLMYDPAGRSVFQAALQNQTEQQLRDFYKAFSLELIVHLQEEKGIMDDLADGTEYIEQNGAFNLNTWLDLGDMAAKKILSGFTGTDDSRQRPTRLEKFQDLQGQVSLHRIFQTDEQQNETAIGIAYEIPSDTSGLQFVMQFKQAGTEKFYENLPTNLVFSGMGIMANNSYSAPAWATGGTGIHGNPGILSEYWAPQRDGLLVISKENKKIEILHSGPYLKSFDERRKLYSNFQSGQINFFSLGQLFLYEGRNLVSPSQNGGCMSKNILAQDEAGKTMYFKIYCTSSFLAVEAIKALGYTKAFNFDAQTHQYDAHVDINSNLFGVPGVESIGFARFDVLTTTDVPAKTISDRKVQFCTDSISCDLEGFVKNYQTLDCKEDTGGLIPSFGAKCF